MKIIILGAGQVGGTLAENLVGENNDITIVDTNGDRLRVLQDKFDLRVVQGHGSHPRVLREAGADDADMLVAVTSSDETNMVACQVAYSLFNTPNRIARIRSRIMSAMRKNSLTQKRYQSTTLSHQNSWLSIIFIA